MNSLVYIALFGWPAVSVLLFAFLEPRRATLVSMLAGWLFLPIAYYPLPGIDFDRSVSCSSGALLGIAIFDSRRLFMTRPSWMDIPIVVLTLCPIPSSLANGLGFQDGAHDAALRVFKFAIPYFLGRLYFFNPTGLREAAVALLMGGLIYVPLCLFEIRMSPQLHTWVYGFHQHEWLQAARGSSWRPTVFLTHGLEVGMWMCASSLSGVWLWVSGTIKKVFGIPVAWVVPPLVITAVLCKSLGAVVLMAVGLTALWLTHKPGSKLLLVVLIAIPIAYVTTRATAIWNGEPLMTIAAQFGEDRADSIGYRFLAEDMLAKHAMRQPVFGWAGWGRMRPSTFDPDEPDYSPDGAWIILLGTYGIVGLGSFLATFLLPPILLVSRLKSSLWIHPWCAPAVILGVILILFMIDSLMNSMLNPFYVMAAGGLGRAVRARASSRVPETQSAAVEGRLGVS